jgi:hypothetical protein
MKSYTVALAAVMAVGMAGPAMAKQSVSIPPGSSSNWVQQQPTSFLNTDVAQVLPDDLAYISAGGNLVAPRANLLYARGMGNGGELGLGVNAQFPFGGSFNGDFAAAWKQQIMRGANLAVAVRPALQLGFTGPVTLGAGVGLPFTLDAGNGHLTLEPRVQFASLANAGATGTGDVCVGYQTPLTDHWSLLAQVDPTFSFAGGAFSLPLGAGARFSPTATSHVDFQVLNMNVTPAVTGNVGLVGVLGHVGF